MTSFAANLQVTLSQVPASASAGTSAEATMIASVSLVALINTWNRMNVITQQPAGGYQPGQLG